MNNEIFQEHFGYQIPSFLAKDLYKANEQLKISKWKIRLAMHRLI